MSFWVAEVTYRNNTKQIGLVAMVPHDPKDCIIPTVHNDYLIPKDSPLSEGIAKKVVPLHEIKITEEDTTSTEVTVLEVVLASKVAYA